LGKIEASRHNWRKIVGIRARHRIAFIPILGGAAVLSQFTGALTRALLVMVVIATPSILLPGVGSDGKQMVALVALFCGALTFVEYSATYPGLIEFRDAPPFNRTRYLMLLVMVFILSVMMRGPDVQSSLTVLVNAIGYLVGNALDFPYSPVRLATLMLPADTGNIEILTVRDTAAMAYLISILALIIFAVILRIRQWPSGNGAFNVWVNLPTFDPTSGGDVIERLERDARVNLALGFLLPFLIPAIVKFGGMGLGALRLETPQTLVWVISAWAFLPASLIMRGIAMSKIAGMIRVKRREGIEAASPGYFAA